MLLIYIDSEIRILLCWGFLEKNILLLLSDQIWQIFEGLYWDQILVQWRLGSLNVDENATMLWDTLQSHEVSVDLLKHGIKFHPSITYIFVCFIVTANISEPLQKIAQINRDINVLRTKLDWHNGRLTEVKEWREVGVRSLGEPTQFSHPLVKSIDTIVVPWSQRFSQN